ncbi:MAG TPA: Arm DNA-binding domain-containing protein [Flavobacterium sp.]|nr:Arm DNA-binding domain-containing protein [Flavobacterium sp.]
MKAKVTLHFYAKSTKANTTGQFPIYIRLTVNGNRLEFSTKKFVDSSRWSADLAKMKGTTEEARSINSYLDLMKSKILDIQMELIHKNQELSIENFKSKLFGLEEKQRMLVAIFQDHNNKIKELVGKEYASGTLERGRICIGRNIRKYE